ncbi:MAG: hypothetical protein ACHQQS_08865 [Thermoanaerobaculales bacterium]
MAFSIAPQPGEQLFFAEHLAPPARRADQFALGVSNQALFLPRKKAVAVSDPYYFQRVPFSEVRRVSLRRYRPVWLLTLAVLLVLLGVIVLIKVSSRPHNLETAKAIGFSVAMVVIGLLIPFVSRNRRALRIDLVSGRFRWAPQITVGGPYFAAAQHFLGDFIMAARHAGLCVEDDLE